MNLINITQIALNLTHAETHKLLSFYSQPSLYMPLRKGVVKTPEFIVNLEFPKVPQTYINKHGQIMSQLKRVLKFSIVFVSFEKKTFVFYLLVLQENWKYFLLHLTLLLANGFGRSHYFKLADDNYLASGMRQNMNFLLMCSALKNNSNNNKKQETVFFKHIQRQKKKLN